MPQQPLVSVCIATYNRKELLAQTLTSLKNQTFSDYEILVCDDCSTDGTFEFLKSLGWKNLRVLRNDTNLNHCGSFAKLFAEARGKYIGMQHDHDLYDSQFLERMVKTIESHATAGMACCAYHVLDGQRMILDPPIGEFNLFPASGLLSGAAFLEVLATQTSTPIPAMGTIFRKEIVERVGGYRPDWYLASDEDLYSRVASASDFAFCPQRLFVMRTRSNDRKPILGSWRSLYTLDEFRCHLQRRLNSGNALTKKVRLLRLRILRDAGLLRESLHLWSRGERHRLNDALDVSVIPTLPSGNHFFNRLEEVLFRTWISLLSNTTRFGERVGSFRRQRLKTNRATS